MKRGRYVASLSPHPLSQLFRFTGAPPYACRRCWCQYYDWRPMALPSPPLPAAKPAPLPDRAPQRL